MGVGTNAVLTKRDSVHDGIHQKEDEEQKRLLDKDEREVLMGRRTGEVTEGGWSWMVVISSFICIMVLDGTGYSFGILLEPLHDELQGGRSAISIAGSMQICTYGLVSPIVASLVEKYGARLPCMFGAVLSSIGLLAASYSSDVPTLICSYSILTGIGFGLMYISSVVVVNKHFVVRRSLVTGIVLCSAGVGTFVVAPVAQIWLEEGGWRFAMRGLAGVCLACTLCGACMFPGKFGGQSERSQASSGEVAPVSAGFGGICLRKLLGDGLASSPLLPVFLLLLFADCLSCLALYIPYTYLPGVAMTAVGEGVTKSFGALLISAAGISNAVGRVLSGWISDQAWSDSLILSTVSISSAVPFLYLFFVISNYTLFIAFAILFGLLTGMWISAAPAALVHLLGVDLLAKAFGIMTLSRGIAVLIGPPLAGMVVDLFQMPGSALIVSGGFMTVASLMYVVTVMVHQRIRKRMEYREI